MALFVGEYSRVSGLGPILAEPLRAKQSVAIGASSTASAAFATTTVVVELVASAACHVEFGPSPTATTSSIPLAANERIQREVSPGDKVAVIQA